jgi:hypothetical protein
MPDKRTNPEDWGAVFTSSVSRGDKELSGAKADAGLGALFEKSEEIVSDTAARGYQDITTSALSTVIDILNQIKNKIG